MEKDCDQAHYFPFSTTPYNTNFSLPSPTLQPEQEPDEEKSRHMPELPVKWMSSKMRLMRKMMAEQARPKHHRSSSHSNDILRVCSNCSTTKTPLWRSGPQGPKSLCNACGIRQMKARRAVRAAAAAASGGVLVPPDGTVPKKKTTKTDRPEVDRTVPFKKRFKIPSANSSSAQKKNIFDNVTVGSSKKLANFHQPFPQEEKDAAILLMALSCGLIHV